MTMIFEKTTKISIKNVDMLKIENQGFNSIPTFVFGF